MAVVKEAEVVVEVAVADTLVVVVVGIDEANETEAVDVPDLVVSAEGVAEAVEIAKLEDVDDVAEAAPISLFCFTEFTSKFPNKLRVHLSLAEARVEVDAEVESGAGNLTIFLSLSLPPLSSLPLFLPPSLPSPLVKCSPSDAFVTSG